MEIYFDNAATTKVCEKVAEAMMCMLTNQYGNPSSLHRKGFEAEKAIEKSRQTIASLLKVQKKDIYFTSGGTEANNMAIFGVANAYHRSGKHLLISSIEHPSVKAAAEVLEEAGFEVQWIPSDEQGYVHSETVAEMVREDTILVSIMHINNEVGTIQKVAEIGKVVKEKNKNTLFHVDGVQSFGKYEIHPQRMGIDLLSISAHKIHGPKGCGAIYVSPTVRLKPIIVGGQQQKGLRAGTENVPAIVGIGVAAELAYKELESNREKITKIRQYLLERLEADVEDIVINSDINEGAYHILNIRMVGIKSEVMLHTLEEANIYISTGSACSSNKKNHSATLQAMGQESEATDQAVRISFSKYNTLEEVDAFIDKLKSTLPLLRRFVKK